MPIEIIPPSSNDGSKYLFSEKTYIHSEELPVLKHVASAMSEKGVGSFSVSTLSEPIALDMKTSDSIQEVVVEGDGNPYVFWALTQDTEHYIENCESCPLARVVPDLDCALNKAWNNFKSDMYRQNGFIAKWESMTKPTSSRAVNQ